MDDEYTAEEKAELAEMRRDRIKIASKLRYVHQPYTSEDMLISREPNEAGYYASHPYSGKPFDESRFRLIKGGWDHEHCFVCTARISPGDEWRAAEPPDEIGLCVGCHAELFGTEPDQSV